MVFEIITVSMEVCGGVMKRGGGRKGKEEREGERGCGEKGGSGRERERGEGKRERKRERERREREREESRDITIIKVTYSNDLISFKKSAFLFAISLARGGRTMHWTGQCPLFTSKAF